MHIEPFYDQQTSTFTYVIVDTNSATTAVIDAVLDYDQDAAKASTENLDQVIAFIKHEGLSNQWILETHIHADHITGAFYLQQHIGGKTAIGNGIKEVLQMWVPLFNASDEIPISGEQFDHLFNDGDQFKIGNLSVAVIHTPGHTPACSTYHVDHAVFVGDTVFAPDLGTARADFPGGNAAELYQSIQKIYALPDDTVMYLCHDYPAKDQKPTSQTTVGIQKLTNKMLNQKTTLDEFVSLREARDKTLTVPKLILPSIQTNMRLGGFGPKAANGIQYISIPVNVL